MSHQEMEFASLSASHVRETWQVIDSFAVALMNAATSQLRLCATFSGSRSATPGRQRFFRDGLLPAGRFASSGIVTARAEFKLDYGVNLPDGLAFSSAAAHMLAVEQKVPRHSHHGRVAVVQPAGQLVQFHLVAGVLAERGQDLGRIILAAVEATVNDSLDASSQGMEESCNSKRRAD